MMRRMITVRTQGLLIAHGNGLRLFVLDLLLRGRECG